MAYRLLFVILRAFAGLRSRPPVSSLQLRTIVCFETTGLGDLLVALPAVRRVAEAFQKATVWLVLRESYCDWVQKLVPAIRCVPIEDSRSIAGILRAASGIRTLRADLAISFSHPRKNALLAYLSGAPRLAGYLSYRNTLTPFRGVTPLESFGCAMRKNVRFGAEPIGERAAKILDLMDIPRDSLADPPTGAVPGAQSVHRTRGHGVVGFAVPYVVLHPFSGWEYRNWPLDRFAVLARLICSEERLDVVFIYESRDAPRVKAVRNELEAVPGVHFVPSDDLTRTAEVVAGASLFVGNDSGPLHLAALLGIPAVGLFGPASPAFTAPPNMRGSTCFHRLPCSPCDQRRCVRPSDPCMTCLSIGLVIDAVRPLLREPAGTSGETHA